MTPTTFVALREHLATASDLAGAMAVLGWDQRTMMPSRGAEVRAARLATLSRLLHEHVTSHDLGPLLRDLEAYEASLPFDCDEASIIRVARRDYLKACMVPTDLKVALTRATNAGYQAWVQARADADFSVLQPHLEAIVSLHRQIIARVREQDDRFAEDYDVLLDDYEPGLTSAEVTRVFDDLKAATIPLVERVRQRADRVRDDLMHGAFPIEAQRALVLEIARQLGFDEDAWRLDVTQHPFASAAAIDDIRITTRYFEDFLNPALFGTMHEFGHGLYEHGVNSDLERTPLQRGASMSFHESQSRMWENLIGRGRPFWTWALPVLQRHFPANFAEASEVDIYRAVNRLGPSFIRVEADELTYNLHIIIRFEIERDLFSGRLEVEDLPATWNARMEDYLGIDVPDVSQGVLQDVHWGSGLFGYFPTYALGNVVSLQLWERIQREIPDLDEQTSRGEFSALRAWLARQIHQHGRKFTPTELLERTVGKPAFDAAPLIRYLTAKVEELYGS